MKNPDDEVTLIFLGNVYTKLKNSAEAEKAFKKANREDLISNKERDKIVLEIIERALKSDLERPTPTRIQERNIVNQEDEGLIIYEIGSDLGTFGELMSYMINLKNKHDVSPEDIRIVTARGLNITNVEVIPGSWAKFRDKHGFDDVQDIITLRRNE